MESFVTSFVGDLEVIGNGTVHTNNEQRLNLLIDGILEMEFEFLTDNENKDFQTSSRVEGSKWIWVLTNYTSSLGTGVLSPLHIGTLKERKLYASFWIMTPNTTDSWRIINYVIYLKKA